MSSNAEFYAGLDQFFEKEIPAAVSQIQRKVGFDVFAGVTKLAPVDKGRFRASWTMQLGTPDESVAPEGAGSKASPLAPAQAPDIQGTDSWGGLKVLWINNQLPYAEELENGSSKQAPSGVVGPVLAGIAVAADSRGLSE